MPFDTLETSRHAGEIVEFYDFRCGVKSWHDTSADEPIVHNSITYQALTLRRSRSINSSDLNQNVLDIEVTWDHPVAQLFNPRPPGFVIPIIAYRKHRSDDEAIPFFHGNVLAVKWRADATAVLHCKSVFSSAKRSSGHRKYDYNCPHAPYGVECGVNMDDYKTSSTAAAVNNNVVSVPAAAGQDNGYYDGGLLYWFNAAGEIDYRTIDEHVGDILKLMFPVNSLAPGDNVEIYPYCNGTLDDCHNKFDGNEDNSGAFPFQPLEVPFNGTMVF